MTQSHRPAKAFALAFLTASLATPAFAFGGRTGGFHGGGFHGGGVHGGGMHGGATHGGGHPAPSAALGHGAYGGPYAGGGHGNVAFPGRPVTQGGWHTATAYGRNAFMERTTRYDLARQGGAYGLQRHFAGPAIYRVPGARGVARDHTRYGRYSLNSRAGYGRHRFGRLLGYGVVGGLAYGVGSYDTGLYGDYGYGYGYGYDQPAYDTTYAPGGPFAPGYNTVPSEATVAGFGYGPGYGVGGLGYGYPALSGPAIYSVGPGSGCTCR